MLLKTWCRRILRLTYPSLCTRKQTRWVTKKSWVLRRLKGINGKVDIPAMFWLKYSASSNMPVMSVTRLFKKQRDLSGETSNPSWGTIYHSLIYAYDKDDTHLTSQLPIGWLKDFANINIMLVSLIFDVDQCPMGWLKDLAPAKAWEALNTLLVFHEDSGWLNDSA